MIVKYDQLWITFVSCDLQSRKIRKELSKFDKDSVMFLSTWSSSLSFRE